MNLLEMYKQLSDEEREELIKLIIKNINEIQKKTGKVLIIT